MLDLLEMKGIRVFSLMENADEVDAYSVWRGDRPFIFLNTKKSGERRRFDAAHELAHLILHRDGAPNGIDAEREANEFAGAFLMPEAGLRAVGRLPNNVDGYVLLKKRWGVSVAALIYRAHEVKLLTYYAFNRLYLELSSRGYRTTEPEPLKPETSQVWSKVLGALRHEGMGTVELAHQLSIPPDELAKLLFGLATIAISSSAVTPGGHAAAPKLRLVKG
jgi:Zn-dependent peptidase ImmA (M78 family)